MVKRNASNQRRKFDRGNGIVVATIVLCIMLTLSLCYFLAGEGILDTVFAEKPTSRTFFALATGGYDTPSLARSSAELIRLRGGAGYVISGEKSEIILAVYPDRASAESVLQKSGDGIFIKEIVADAPRLKWAKDDVLEASKDALKYFDIAYNSLYENSNRLADVTLSVEDVRTQNKVLTAQIEDIKSTFYLIAADRDEEEITEIKLALVTCLALLDNVDTSGNLPSVLSSLRYQAVQLVLCYQALASSI